MSDPRIEAAAAAMWEQRPMTRTEDGSPRPWDEVPGRLYAARYRGQAQAALAAADAVDPLRNPDEALVEKVATALARADGWKSLTNASPRHQADLHSRARMVLAVITEAG